MLPKVERVTRSNLDRPLTGSHRATCHMDKFPERDWRSPSPTTEARTLEHGVIHLERRPPPFPGNPCEKRPLLAIRIRVDHSRAPVNSECTRLQPGCVLGTSLGIRKDLKAGPALGGHVFRSSEEFAAQPAGKANHEGRTARSIA